MINKIHILSYLEKMNDQDARQVAEAFKISCEAAGMLLLRFFRQGLVRREFDPNDRMYFYSLSGKGQERLRYFRSRVNPVEKSYAKTS